MLWRLWSSRPVVRTVAVVGQFPRSVMLLFGLLSEGRYSWLDGPQLR